MVISMSKSDLTPSVFPEHLLSQLKKLPADCDKFWLACSGGLDSSVLLHLFYSIKNDIKNSVEVVYVDHALNESSQSWGEFCLEQCHTYGFPLRTMKIEGSCPKGTSIEAWAREKRYELIAEKMQQKDVLFTAHHQNDQIETFFLQVFRGAGPRGLACMPFIKHFISGFHVRPLLDIKRTELEDYANKQSLKWCDDKSNEDVAFDRNYLRHKVIPDISTRWPAYGNSICRLVEHQKEYKLLLDEIAEQDLERALHNNMNTLRLNVVQALSKERQKNLVFFWLDKLQLASPSYKHIDEILNELINKDTNKSPCVNWQDVEVRRFKNLLYASKTLKENDIKQEFVWDLREPIQIFDETLMASSTIGTGISKAVLKNAELRIRYRQGGERIEPENASHSKSVKKLFQERNVLPWFRNSVPLIYINDELAMIPGLCIDKKYRAAKDESSWQITWTGFDKVVQSSD